MALISFSYTTGTGVLEVDMDQLKGALESGTISIAPESIDTGSITAESVTITQADAARGFLITQTNDSASANIKLTHTSEGADTNYCQFCFGGDTNRRTAYFERNLASTKTNTPVVTILQNNASDDQPALAIQQDTTTIEAIDFIAGSIAFDFAAAMVTTGAGTMAVNNSPGGGATTWCKVEVNGTTGYIPIHYAS